MPTPDRQTLGVLALCGDPQPMQALLQHLQQAGLQVDAVRDLEGARSVFFGAGGHDCLVIGPDVPPGLASRVASSLATVDPQLAMATFGPKLADGFVHGRAATRTARLAGFHPSSRAGQGALLRFLRSLGPR